MVHYTLYVHHPSHQRHGERNVQRLQVVAVALFTFGKMKRAADDDVGELPPAKKIYHVPPVDIGEVNSEVKLIFLQL